MHIAALLSSYFFSAEHFSSLLNIFLIAEHFFLCQATVNQLEILLPSTAN